MSQGRPFKKQKGESTAFANAGVVAKSLKNALTVQESIIRSTSLENEDVFMTWMTIVSNVLDKLHPKAWDVLTRNGIDARFEIISPRENVLQDANCAIEHFVPTIKPLLFDSLSGPSDFAKETLWADEQIECDYPILCHRPPEAYGLPLCTLHDAFRLFMVDLSTPLPDDLEVSTARVAASKLCGLMGGTWDTETGRSEKFDEFVKELFAEFEKGDQHYIKPFNEIHSDIVDPVYQAASYSVLLREDKCEPGNAGGDVYMQAARRYDLASKSILSSESLKIKDRSVPMFLVCVEGPTLSVCGGLHDGEKPIIEPLGDVVHMLEDGSGYRHRQVSTLLWALKRGINRLISSVNLVAPSYSPSTPRVYMTCRLINGSTGKLSDFTRLSKRDLRLFKATLSDVPDRDDYTVVVKLIQFSYGLAVHRSLAEAQLAAGFIGESRIDGAPLAVVMEYLDPNEWITVFNLFDKSVGTSLNKAYSVVKPAVNKVLEHLKSNKMVHGDLRSNNILVKVSSFGPPVEDPQGNAIIKVVDFDWAGEESKVFYSVARNPYITWPGVDGGLIERGHDTELVSTWI